MARKLYFTILLLLFVSIMYAQYIPDVLGDQLSAPDHSDAG